MDLRPFSLIIDALFGIGLNRPLRGEPICSLVESINQSTRPVVSVDVPSGLDAQTGAVWGAAIKADLTLTFVMPKIGFFTATGTRLCGRIQVVPLPFPPRVIAREARSYRVMTESWARRFLPSRPLSGNKTTFGHVAICAGRPGFWGAGILSSTAAFRVGAGYVTWASSVAPVEALKLCPEVLTLSLSEIKNSTRQYSAFVVGPGLGVDSSTLELLQHLRTIDCPTLVDADALTVLAQSNFNDLPANWILTPHSGELARLLGVSSDEIERDRFAAVRAASQKFGCFVLLKGYRTLICSGGKTLIIASGNSALAKAGTGDVLSGLIGGLLAQGLSSWRATAWGAFVHGRLADEWVESGRDISSLVASDLADHLPQLLHRLRLAHLDEEAT